jgi:hypothetical protein
VSSSFAEAIARGSSTTTTSGEEGSPAVTTNKKKAWDIDHVITSSPTQSFNDAAARDKASRAKVIVPVAVEVTIDLNKPLGLGFDKVLNVLSYYLTYTYAFCLSLSLNPNTFFRFVCHIHHFPSSSSSFFQK